MHQCFFKDLDPKFLKILGSGIKNLDFQILNFFLQILNFSPDPKIFKDPLYFDIICDKKTLQIVSKVPRNPKMFRLRR